MIAALLASLWAPPAAAAAAGFLLAFGLAGDGRLAVIAAAALGLAALAFRLVGPKAALTVLGLGALFFADRRGFRRGADHAARTEKADADQAVERAERARADADRRSADPERLRDDDGFRRG